jgi:hypothetical protein
MSPRLSPCLRSGRQRPRWWLVVCLLSFLAATLTSWLAPLTQTQHAPATLSSAARSDSSPAPLPSRALDVDGDSVPDLVLPAPVVSLTTQPAIVRRARRATAAVLYGRQIAPLPRPPRVTG